MTAPSTVSGPALRIVRVMSTVSSWIMVAGMAFCADRSAPGSIVVTTGVATSLLVFGSSTSGLVSPAKALLVMVPPVASTRPFTVIGGRSPIKGAPV
ncbi:hypothetical protein D3C87_1039500 [compost metagenome]